MAYVFTHKNQTQHKFPTVFFKFLMVLLRSDCFSFLKILKDAEIGLVRTGLANAL